MHFCPHSDHTISTALYTHVLHRSLHHALFVAELVNDLLFLRALMSKGAEPSSQPPAHEGNYYLLHLAVYLNHHHLIPMCTLLCEGTHALHVAVQEMQFHVIPTLIVWCKVNDNQHGHLVTPLHAVAMHGR